jgi:plastocyanin
VRCAVGCCSPPWSRSSRSPPSPWSPPRAARPRPPPGSAVAGACVAVGQYDIFFRPNLITLPADTPVTLVLRDDGALPHNFSVDAHNNPNAKNLGISVTLQPGQSAAVTVNAPAGTYYFYCNVPGHEAAGMYGYLQVKPGAAIATAVAKVTPPAGAAPPENSP